MKMLEHNRYPLYENLIKWKYAVNSLCLLHPLVNPCRENELIYSTLWNIRYPTF